MDQWVQDWAPSSEVVRADAVRLARQGIESGKDDPDALAMGANTLSWLAGDHDTAAGALDRALILNPNCARAWRVRGYVLLRQNRPEPALDALRRALRLSPLDPLGFLIIAASPPPIWRRGNTRQPSRGPTAHRANSPAIRCRFVTR
jgi:tetratricopeptide (TPR) repeat protein